MRYLILLLFLVYAQASPGQKYLYVHKTGKPNAYTLKSGDEIVFRLKGEKHFRKDFIVTFTDSSVVFNYGYVPLSAINAIGKRCLGKPDLAFGLAKGLQYGGAIYFGADVFNSLLVRGEEFYMDRSTLAISGTMIATGIILSKTTRRFVKIRIGEYGLKVIE